jgi:hypothetical protein
MAIIRCDCECPQQDQLHGKGHRVANPISATTPTWRCTKCLKEVSASSVVRK